MSDTTRLTEAETTSQTYENREMIDGSQRLATGYDGDSITENFHVPACGLEDVDKAMFGFFDKALQIKITQRNKQEPVPVIFATGERFALVKRQKPIRDSNGAIILPLISIRRSGLSQSISQAGRGRDTGDMIVKKRLSDKDRHYQKLQNKMHLSNQDNVATDNHIVDQTDPKKSVKPGTVGNREYKKSVSSPSLSTELGDNIFEIITIPMPKFVRMTYEITFWAQYTTHMNSMIEQMMIAYHAPGNNFKISTEEGYWFVAYVQDDFNDGNNFDDFTDQERVIRYSFSVVVDGYLVANEPEGKGSPLRSYFSAPSVSFGMSSTTTQVRAGTENKSPIGSMHPDDFILGESEILDKHGMPMNWRGRPNLTVRQVEIDPFCGHETVKYVPVISRNARSGETVMSGQQMETFTGLEVSVENKKC